MLCADIVAVLRSMDYMPDPDRPVGNDAQWVKAMATEGIPMVYLVHVDLKDGVDASTRFSGCQNALPPAPLTTARLLEELDSEGGDVECWVLQENEFTFAEFNANNVRLLLEEIEDHYREHRREIEGIAGNAIAVSFMTANLP